MCCRQLLRALCEMLCTARLHAMLWLLMPYVFFHLWWRSRKQPEYLEHIGERFGRYRSDCYKPVIWIHTVSVGETRAAVTLVHSLRERYPDHQILLTHTTPTGRAASEQLYGDDVFVCICPMTTPLPCDVFCATFGRASACCWKPRSGSTLSTLATLNQFHCCCSMRDFRKNLRQVMRVFPHSLALDCMSCISLRRKPKMMLFASPAWAIVPCRDGQS